MSDEQESNIEFISVAFDVSRFDTFNVVSFVRPENIYPAFAHVFTPSVMIIVCTVLARFFQIE